MGNLFNLGYNRLATTKDGWKTVGTISVAGTTLTADSRDWSDVLAYFNTVSTTYLAWEVPDVANAVELRFQTTADADADVVEVWGACGEDHVTLLATLTLTGGTQTGDSSLVFVDTIVASTENLFKVGKVMDSATNRICRYMVDLYGYDRLLFIATTLTASSTLVVEGRAV